MPDIAPDAERLATITTLYKGAHNPDGKMCVMEAVAYVAHEPWSDSPECACPVISTFLRSWNDALLDEDRTRLLLPMVPRLVNTKSAPEIEHSRSLMAANWLVRAHAPAWLRLGGMADHADALEALPEITGMAMAPSIRPAIEAARRDADAARDAARAAAWDAARDAAGAAAGDAARAAAGAAAGDATWAAAEAAAWAKLKPTCVELQQSALALVDRMIAAE